MQYPNKIKKEYHKLTSHKNRGMELESSLNKTNAYYLEEDIAIIYKKPTPIGIVDVKYYNKIKTIDKAYFKAPSTLDYNGLYKGKYIEFEAKETKNRTSFPLSNIHQHQIVHLNKVIEHGGIGFLIIKMNDNIFYLDGNEFIQFFNNFKRKSIPYNYLLEKGIIIKEGYRPELDYLKIVNEKYFKEDLWKKLKEKK